MNKDEIKNILDLLNQVEIKGDSNVAYMYTVFLFLKTRYQEMEEAEKKNDK